MSFFVTRVTIFPKSRTTFWQVPSSTFTTVKSQLTSLGLGSQRFPVFLHNVNFFSLVGFFAKLFYLSFTFFCSSTQTFSSFQRQFFQSSVGNSKSKKIANHTLGLIAEFTEFCTCFVLGNELVDCFAFPLLALPLLGLA